jgi:basic membrane protein A
MAEKKVTRRGYAKYAGAGIVVIAVAGVGAYYVSRPEPTPTEVESYKVALLLPSPVGDFGWNYAAHNAMKEVEGQIPDMELSYSDQIPEADAEPYLRDYVELGCKVIFAHSWGYQDACFKLVKEYPEVAFLYPGGGPYEVGVATYYARDYESQYLAGMVAGMMTETNVIGFVGAYPIETLVYGINAFIKGAKDINPKIEARVAFTSSWYDPPKEKETAFAHIDAGADFLSHYCDSAAVLEAAQERGVHVFGMYTDSRFVAPKAVAGIIWWNWVPFFKEIIEGWRSGTLTSDDLNTFYYRGIAEGMTDLTYFGPMVPQDVLDKVDEKRQQIISGEYEVAANPEFTWE